MIVNEYICFVLSIYLISNIDTKIFLSSPLIIKVLDILLCLLLTFYCGIILPYFNVRILEFMFDEFMKDEFMKNEHTSYCIIFGYIIFIVGHDSSVMYIFLNLPDFINNKLKNI